MFGKSMPFRFKALTTALRPSILLANLSSSNLRSALRLKAFVAILSFAFCGLLGCARPIYQDSTSSSRPLISNKLEAPPASLTKLGLQASISWKKMQTEEDYGSFVLKFWRPNLGDQSPVPQEVTQNLEVKLMMPSMGHGSSPVTIRRVDIGTYLVEDVYFSMPGDWEIQVSLHGETGPLDEASIPFHY